MAHVIRVIARPGGVKAARPGPEWVVDFDPDAGDGRGHMVTTFDPARARRFAGHVEAVAFWRQQSRVRPLRADGTPNRPLTAVDVLIERV